MIKQIKNGLIFGITAGFSILLIVATYATWTSLGTVSNNQPLTADFMNDIIDNQKDLDSRLNNLDQNQLATAWVNFDGANCPGNICVINGEYNVDSVTFISTGRYSINFKTAMNNTGYSLVASNSLGNGAGSVQIGNNSLLYAIVDNNYSNVSTQYNTKMNVVIFGGKN